MYRYTIAALCFVCMFVFQVQGQKTILEPISITTGTVLTFHLQTRLNPVGGNEMDLLPRGTVLTIRMLNAIDSGVDRDGSKFRGEVVSPVVSGNEVVLHSDAEVRGVLALLRSRNHPEGFRYELLITRVTDHGRSYDLTASLNPSFADRAPERDATIKAEGSKVLK